MNRDSLVRLLRRRGYEVLTAGDGAEAVAMGRSEGPDLILLDMSLPVLDGWEAARRLKTSPASRSIPIIGLTAHAMSADRDKVLAIGCDEYESKPIQLDRLVAKMEALLAKQP